MNRLLVVVALIVAIPALGTAAPCLPGSLLGYVGLGAAGCQIGSATFFDFEARSSFFGGSAIDPSQIEVIPMALALGPRLDFVLTGNAGAGEILGAAIGYSISGPKLSLAILSMAGSGDSGDGVATVIEDVCAGDVFVSDPSNCLNPPQSSILVIHDPLLGYLGPDSTPLPVASFFDVFVDLTLDGGSAGSASLSGPGTITNQFTVPEPAAVLLMGLGLMALCAWRQRQRNQQITLGKESQR
jgi:hypothetical protein